MNAWPIIPVSDCARVVGGATPKSTEAEYWGGDIPWITPKDLSDLEGKYISDTPRKITEAGLKSCSSELLPPNSVLFSSRAPIGHVAINTVPMATNQGFKSFVPGPQLDPSFLYWWLKCHRARLEALGNGATFKEVSKAVVERVEIPLPPLPEQKRIAAILDQADELRRKRQRAIDRLNQLGQAIFYEMFGSVRDTPRTPISDFADVKGGKRLPKGAEYSSAPTEHPYIRVSDLNGVGISTDDLKFISTEIHQTVRRYIVHSSDVIISIAGTIGVTAPVPVGLDGANLTENAAKITPKAGAKFDPIYLAWALRMPEARAQIQASTGQVTIGKLALFRIEKIEIPMPPLDEQVRFSEAIGLIDDELAKFSRSRQRTTDLFTSLQHRAFRGEL